jgi:predicted secreted hydrolase
MTVAGTLTVEGMDQAVTGEAWMDHQWGNFASYLTGGWDWFAVQLDDGTDMMLYLFRDETEEIGSIEGTLVAPDGTARELDANDVSVDVTASWTSPRTGVTYPHGWTIRLTAVDMTLTLTPTLADQELDTRATTTMIYWEGEVEVVGTRNGEPAVGLGYVELTGYAD